MGGLACGSTHPEGQEELVRVGSFQTSVPNYLLVPKLKSELEMRKFHVLYEEMRATSILVWNNVLGKDLKEGNRQVLMYLGNLAPFQGFTNPTLAYAVTIAYSFLETLLQLGGSKKSGRQNIFLWHQSNIDPANLWAYRRRSNWFKFIKEYKSELEPIMHASAWMGSLLDPTASETMRMTQAIMLNQMVSTTVGKILKEATWRSGTGMHASCGTQLVLIQTNLILQMAEKGQLQQRRIAAMDIWDLVANGHYATSYNNLVKNTIKRDMNRYKRRIRRHRARKHARNVLRRVLNQFIASTSGKKPDGLKDPITCDFDKDKCLWDGDAKRTRSGRMNLFAWADKAPYRNLGGYMEAKGLRLQRPLHISFWVTFNFHKDRGILKLAAGQDSLLVLSYLIGRKWVPKWSTGSFGNNDAHKFTFKIGQHVRGIKLSFYGRQSHARAHQAHDRLEVDKMELHL